VQVDKKLGVMGITVSNRLARAQPHLGEKASGLEGLGVLVTALDSEGLSRKAGLHIGDCIIAVNGVQVGLAIRSKMESLCQPFCAPSVPVTLPHRALNAG
jgi:S1-C subfamily serine protease